MLVDLNVRSGKSKLMFVMQEQLQKGKESLIKTNPSQKCQHGFAVNIGRSSKKNLLNVLGILIKANSSLCDLTTIYQPLVGA